LLVVVVAVVAGTAVLVEMLTDQVQAVVQVVVGKLALQEALLAQVP
jgi:hypothetical protein